MDRFDRTLIIAFAIGIALSVVRRTLLPDARWWNLVMAAALLIVLGLYLLRDRKERR